MTRTARPIPSWQLYGEDRPFPDVLHIERIVDRAAGLHWRIAPHRHLHLHQVFLVLSGAVGLTIDGRQARAVPPVVMSMPRGTVHGFDFAAGTEGYVLTLPASGFPEVFATGAPALMALGQAFACPAPDGIAADFAALAAAHAGVGPLRQLRLRAAAMALCCTLAEIAPARSAPARPADPRIGAFEALVRGSLDRPCAVGDYARTLGLSERHLRRMCLQATGLPAQAMIETIRLREACRLLAYTRMRVQEVGFALGYEDPAYFSRAFRRGCGLSPTAYRARLEA